MVKKEDKVPNLPRQNKVKEAQLYLNDLPARHYRTDEIMKTVQLLNRFGSMELRDAKLVLILEDGKEIGITFKDQSLVVEVDEWPK